MTTEAGFECPDCNARLNQSIVCPICGWRGKPGAARAQTPAYREPTPRPDYVEPTEAERREIRIKIAETLDKLDAALISPRRNQEPEQRYDGFVSRFANDGERQAEAQRQLAAFRAWQEGRTTR